jgi:hypothetical protein
MCHHVHEGDRSTHSPPERIDSTEDEMHDDCIRCGNPAVTGSKFCRSHDPGTGPGLGARIEEKLNQYKDGIIREDQLKYELGMVIGEHQAEPRKMPTEKTRLKHEARFLLKQIRKHAALERQRAKVEDLRRVVRQIEINEDNPNVG